MKTVIIFLIFAISLNAQNNFSKYFNNKTLRLDFYHTGNANHETISFDELIEEPFWGGSQTNLIDTFYFGNYYLKVFSKKGKLIYSRGFSTLFKEWQSTEEAKHTVRTFPGVVTFPFPKDSVIVEIDKRDSLNIFYSLFKYVINPNSYFIKKDNRHKSKSFKVQYSGNYNKKLDIVFISEGYKKSEMNKFKDDCKKYASYLFDCSPFKENKNKINIWGVEAISDSSGADIPEKNIWKSTALNSSYYTFNSERYLMTIDYKTVRDYAANVPYDQIYILVNSNKYGGGAIYNFYSLGITGNKNSEQVFVHEFGHGLAGLADEYVDLSTFENFYPKGVEPWEPNITTLVHFDKKWKDLVSPSTPIPTPATTKYKNVIGVFEGAGYVPKGVYRSTENSIMRAFSSNEFNKVSKRAIQRIIDFYSK